MILIVMARMSSHMATTYVVYNKRHPLSTDLDSEEIIGTLFYANCVIEFTLNVLVLYYRIKT